MSNGWDESARAWIENMGERGDWSREHVLDPAMLARLEGRRFDRALDVGCGEGRFCRILKPYAVEIVGIDPTSELLEAAKARDPAGSYYRAEAEALPFPPESFDLVISCLTMLDIPDFRAAIGEIARVMKAGATLLVANQNSFVTASPKGWVKNENGERLYFPIDNYLQERTSVAEWAGVRIHNHHRPLAAYMSALLAADLELRFFDEPRPVSGDPMTQAKYLRVPWFLLMEWRKPAA